MKDHVAPAVAFANRGYHVLVEKPMAVTEQDCRWDTEILSYIIWIWENLDFRLDVVCIHKDH